VDDLDLTDPVTGRHMTCGQPSHGMRPLGNKCKIISALNICGYIQLSSSNAMSCLIYQLAELSAVPLLGSHLFIKSDYTRGQHAWWRGQTERRPLGGPPGPGQVCGDSKIVQIFLSADSRAASVSGHGPVQQLYGLASRCAAIALCSCGALCWK